MEGKERLYIELVLHRSQEILFLTVCQHQTGKSGSGAPKYTKAERNICLCVVTSAATYRGVCVSADVRKG